MAVHTVYPLPIPAPNTGSFTHGEVALSVAATIGGAAVGTYYMSKLFNFDGGLYVLKSVVDDTASWWFGVTGSQALLHRGAIGLGAQQIEIYIQPGTQRLDLILQNTSVGACYAAFSLFKNGELVYASAGVGWVFDTTAILDADIPATTDPRLSLPAFTLLPNWASGITENLTWNTDILVSENAVEQRRALREFPRRSLEASFLRKGAGRQRIDSFLTHVGQSKMLLPLWHEQYRVQGGVSIGSTYVQFEIGSLELREFQVNDIVFVNAGDPDNYELLVVASINLTLGRLVWTTPPVKQWAPGTRIIPVRLAVVMDAPQLQNLVDRVGSSRARFELSEPDSRFSASWGHCCPLFKLKPNRAEDVVTSYERTSFVIDNGVGPTLVTDPGGRAQVGTRLALQLRGRDKVVALRKFLLAARGKAVRFWCPSFTQDIEPTGALGGTTFECKVTGASEYMKYRQDARTSIEVVKADGSPSVYAKLVSILRVGAIEVVTVDTALPSIALTAIERIQFVVPSRFDQDSFEFNHMVDESAAVTTSLVTRSVDDAGLADIDCE